MMMRRYFYFITGLSIFVALLVIGSIISIGGPGSAKAIKLDEERIQNFSEIQEVLDEYYYGNDRLPKTLQEAIEKTGRTSVSIVDPETKKQYEYKPSTGTSFQLCTEFSTDSKEVSSKYQDYDYNYYERKPHTKGYYCITYNLDDYDDYYGDYYDDEYYDEYWEEEIDEFEEFSEPQASNVQNLKLNVAWQDKNDNVHYTLTNAYLSDTLAYEGEDYGSYWVEKENDEKYLVLEVSVRNLGSNVFYVDTDKILRLSKNGVRIAEDDYSETSIDKGGTETAYSMFIVDDQVNHTILFGDLQSPQTVSLDFNTATETFGIFDLQTGFEEQEELGTSPVI